MQTKTNPFTIIGEMTTAAREILTDEALEFITRLHYEFNARRQGLLLARKERQAAINEGHMPNFLTRTQGVREATWSVAPTPDDLQDRRVEITGPVDRKMMINALNSGAKVFMADFEDSLSPTWANVIDGQINLRDAARREIAFYDDTKDKHYTLNDEIATLMVRPRGWHLDEKHLEIKGVPVSASLFDFGLFMFHTAPILIEAGSGPYFYLPKLENHLEARLWNDVFNFAQQYLDIPVGTIRATVLIENILAAFEMEEILYELRDHSAGLNAGRWDYIFSAIKKFANYADFALPDRSKVTMTVPFMRAYTEQMIHICHKRGAHAIGGMAAFIPSRRDEAVNRNAFAKVRADKEREARDGCDGTWVAHPDLVPLVKGIFDEVLGDAPHQKDKLREDVEVTAADLLSLPDTPGDITEEGIRLNINVGLAYLNAWLMGNGAAAIYNLMEDTATAEISRAQLWQWLTNACTFDDDQVFTPEIYQRLRDEEIVKLGGIEQGRMVEAVAIMDQLVLADAFVDFLTTITYDYLD